MSRRQRIIVVLAASLAFLCKLYLALFTEGSLDAASYADYLAKVEQLGGVGAYHVRGVFNNPFNNPPFVIHFLKAVGWLAHQTQLPFVFWLRLPCVLADAGSLYLIWKLMGRTHAPRRGGDTAWLLVLLALNPVSLIISGYHGNTDPVVSFFVLLSAYFLETRTNEDTGGRILFAAIAYGLALNFKVAPLIFAPAVWFYLPQFRRRVEFFSVAALVFLLGSLPYILSDPFVITRSVFGYGSIYGHWGWTYLAAKLFPASLQFARPPHDVVGAHAVAAAFGKWLTLALIVAAAFLFSRRRSDADDKSPLTLQLGFAAALFLFLTPGFGSQYLSWLVPFVVFLGLRASLLYFVAGGLFLSVSYSCFVYRAAPPFYCGAPLTESLMPLCWISVFVVLIHYA
ncbi:MAG TPA: glycosyltransferase family 39 protein, partial [Pyrinomonadaceae bacterium]|nr:glycosyltransferase family 39 protein [Pyrinomonadaceae bacterium]